MSDHLNIVQQLMRLFKINSDREVGTGAYKIFAAGAHTGLNLDSIIIGSTAATFTVYEENGIDVLTDRGMANVIPAGAYLPAPTGSVITTVTSDQIFIGYLSVQ